MSAEQKVLVNLTLLSETCKASIIPLEESPSKTAHASPNHPLQTIRKDLLSILTLIYTNCTKVTLTLRPNEAAHSASLVPIQELTKYVSSLTTCATLFDEHGLILAEDVRRLVKELCEAVRAFALTFSSVVQASEGNAGSGSSSSVAGGKEVYLVRTGEVHGLIEKIRKELPESNLVAVKRRWSQDKEILEDTAGEVNSMIEDADNGEEVDDEGFEEDDEDTEWDELGFGSNKRMSGVELERTKKIQLIIRIITLYHKRIQTDLLKESQLSPRANIALDALPVLSHSLLLQMEDLVAALYAPQNLSTISKAITALVETSKITQEKLLSGGILPERQSKTAEGKGSGEGIGSAKKEKDVRKWFDSCAEQIDKMYKTLEEAWATEQAVE